MARVPIFRRVVLSTGLLYLTACGGGGGGGGGPSSYTIGGNVSGLSGSGLVLQNSGSNNLSVAASGTFTFSTALTTGSAYTVTVLTQPSSPSQTCTVSSGAGSVTSANVTNVTVACTTNTYSVGGSVSGLTGAGLVLQNNSGSNLTVAADGNFTFATPVASGANYAVSVSTQPTGQTCTVASGSGTVGSAAITGVNVSCRAQVGKFLYVSNTTTNNIYSYSINPSTGALTALGTPVATGVAPTGVTVVSSEKFLYTTNIGASSNPPTVSAYSINGATGALTQLAGSPYPLSVSAPPGNGPSTLAPLIVDTATTFGYVNNFNDGKIYGAHIDSATGTLTEIAGLPRSLGGALGYGVLDASGKYLYMPYAQPAGGGTFAGYVATLGADYPFGGLPVLGAPTATGGALPVFTLRHPSGKFLLALNQPNPGATGGSVAVFSIDANSGALVPVAGSPFDAGGPALIAGFHPTKNFVYVRVTPAAPANGYLRIFQIDPTTGVLTSTGAPDVAIGQGTGFPIVELTGKFLIIPNSNSNNIQSFSIDQASGALTQVAGSPFTTDQVPLPLRPDPSNKYYYGLNGTSNTISSYSLDLTTGAIARISNLPTGTGPAFIGLAGRQ